MEGRGAAAAIDVMLARGRGRMDAAAKLYVPGEGGGHALCTSILPGISLARCGGMSDMFRDGGSLAVVSRGTFDAGRWGGPSSCDVLASALYAMGAVPPERPVIVIPDDMLSGDAAGAAGGLPELETVFDETGALSKSPKVPAHYLGFDEGGRPAWTGPIPAELAGALELAFRAQARKMRFDMLHGIVAPLVFVPGPTTAFGKYPAFMTAALLLAAVRALSGGHVVFSGEEVADTSPSGETRGLLPDHMLWGLRQMSFPDFEPAGDGRDAEFDERLSGFEGAIEIWKAFLSSAGLHLDCDRFDSRMEEKIRSAGEILGVYPALEAFFSGVPLTDVLAGAGGPRW